MKLISITLLTCLLLITSAQAMNYTVTVKGGLGETQLNSNHSLNNQSLSEEGYLYSAGAGLAFENNVVTGLEFSNFSSDSFFGATDRFHFSEYKLYFGYRFNLAPHFRITPAAGISRWTLESKDGALLNLNDEDLSADTYRGHDTFAQLNIEFPINSLVAVVSSINYTQYDFGAFKSAQVGVIFQF